MEKSRLESFTDAIIAIIMTILVLELKVPHSAEFSALWDMKEQILVYALSFFLLAIYWVNHHHLMNMATKVNGKILWISIIMLFWMSLIPFVTAWVGAYTDSLVPSVTYGVIFLLTNISYGFLSNELIKENGKNSKVYNVYNKNTKMSLTIVLSILVNFLAFISPILVLLGCLIISIMWVIPSKKAEQCSDKD
ncbi:TMEM175 family protein [Clostridium massiliamazoniense]|uniref:TMEM175 family protein n=1 Tax=Clostridium massiliamazoniense TaxID=1347366 RepID=UPI0006D7C10A|nr:TMEM175 family protein [Clostridium massiliamazoniense]